MLELVSQYSKVPGAELRSEKEIDIAPLPHVSVILSTHCLFFLPHVLTYLVMI